MSVPKVLIPMADYGHDPTETAVSFDAFKAAGFEVHFATENGKVPTCDEKMLKGITQKLLGATIDAVTKHDIMAKTPEFNNPISWSAPEFSLDSYNLIFLPGGHEKGVRQLIDSSIISTHLGNYFPKILKSASQAKAVSAVCHGVQVLSEAKLNDGGGKSVIHDCDTTALPAKFEQLAYWGTRLFLGDYYKTYGAGTNDVEEFVKSKLDNPEKQWKGSLGLGPFVVEDQKYNYISGRYPGDVELLAQRTIALVQSIMAKA